jgi:hypothetical protein
MNPVWISRTNNDEFLLLPSGSDRLFLEVAVHVCTPHLYLHHENLAGEAKQSKHNIFIIITRAKFQQLTDVWRTYLRW